jgi:hypothetical protein
MRDNYESEEPPVMQDSDWDIRRSGRRWGKDEFHQRLDLLPEKLEVWEGKLLWSDEERTALLGLLLENLGTERVVRLGNLEAWREAIALRWLREVKATDPTYQAQLRTWASEFMKSTIQNDLQSVRVDVEIGSPVTDAQSVVPSVLVKAEAVLSWLPADALETLAIERRRKREFLQRDGSTLRRSTGAVIVRVGGAETFDEVVFAEPGDSVVLGGRSLDGLNLLIDPFNRRLVDAGPTLGAVAESMIRHVPGSLPP